MISPAKTGIAAAILVAAIFTAPAFAQRESLSERIARLEQRLDEDRESSNTLSDLLYQLNQLQAEVRELRGMVEDQRFEIQSLRSSQQDQYLDLDRRLTELQQGRPSTAAPGSSAQPPVEDRPFRRDPDIQQPDRTVATPELPEVREPVDAQIETSGLGRTQADPVVAIADAADAKQDYDAAFDALKNGRYAEASRLFARFVEQYPNSEYTDNAQYWLGESYYVTRNYRVALDAFQTLLSRFPESAKAPDAQLKIGLSYYSLQNWEAAEQELKSVIDNYPDTTVARLAENRLRSMRIEGYIQ